MHRWMIALLLCTMVVGCEGQATEETPPTPRSSFGPGPFNIFDPTTGLGKLNAYNATLTISFEGMRGVSPYQWTRTYEMRVVQKPPARQLTLHKREVSKDMPADLWMAEIGDVVYELNEQGMCEASLSPQGGLLAQHWEPASFLSGLVGVEEAGVETVNKVSANHYTFDERAVGQEGLTDTIGEVWVANDGHLVKYFVKTEAGANYFGEDTAGTLTFDYDLTEPKGSEGVELPKDCPPGLIDAPLMSSAQSVRRLPGVTLYSTHSSIESVIAFYQRQLPELAWQLSGEPIFTPSFGILEGTQREQKLSIIASSGDGGTTVWLVLENAENSPASAITPTP